MKIETKFNVGDAVYVLYYNKMHKFRIDKIEIHIYGTDKDRITHENYKLDTYEFISNNHIYSISDTIFGKDSLFSTKEDLISHL